MFNTSVVQFYILKNFRLEAEHNEYLHNDISRLLHQHASNKDYDNCLW